MFTCNEFMSNVELSVFVKDSYSQHVCIGPTDPPQSRTNDLHESVFDRQGTVFTTFFRGRCPVLPPDAVVLRKTEVLNLRFISRVDLH